MMSVEHEKLSISQAESPCSENYLDAHIISFTPEEQKKIIRRIDRRLLITCGVVYTASLIDRVNISAANVAGMSKDLNLVGNRYNVIVLVFFIPYVLCQPPATIVMRKLGPRIFLPVIMVLLGACLIGFGFVKKWNTMVGLRVILGGLEAGIFPGCTYLLSTWYPRYELQRRYAVFFLIGSIASALGGILAYGLTQMSGLGGLEGWRWIFIVEGITTCVIGIASYPFLVGFPENATKSWHFLDDRETGFVVASIQQDRNDAVLEPFDLSTYLKSALDLKVWGFACLFMLTTTVTYAIAFFLPVILRLGMGFSLAKTQCLIAPPYAAAGLIMYICGHVGDKYHIRGPIVIGNAIIGLIGLSVLGYAHNNAIRYFGVFLAAISANGNVPAVLTFQANNIRGQWKRALCSATLVGAGGVGGIIGSTVFRDQDAPKYHPGILTTIIANALIILVTLLLQFKFWRANKRAAAGGKIIERQHGFRYTL